MTVIPLLQVHELERKYIKSDIDPFYLQDESSRSAVCYHLADLLGAYLGFRPHNDDVHFELTERARGDVLQVTVHWAATSTIVEFVGGPWAGQLRLEELHRSFIEAIDFEMAPPELVADGTPVHPTPYRKTWYMHSGFNTETHHRVFTAQ